MSNNPSQEQNYAMLKWLNNNRHQVIYLYKNQYIAYNEKGIISHGENLTEVLELAELSEEHFLIYLVPAKSRYIQILPICFKAIVRHEWQPSYSVKLKHNDKEINTTMLVDSGAEISLISYKLGLDLDYYLADGETILLAETIGGNVEYVLRNVQMTIDDYTLIVPVAWLQNPIDTEQLLLGREIIFDKFNIEFRQAEEKIVFAWRS